MSDFTYQSPYILQQDETNAFMTSAIDNAIESPADSLTSLSEQIAILEERLADCKTFSSW